MPAAIRNIELSVPATDVTGLAGYDRCMLVFRWRGVVIGRAFSSVLEGRVDGDLVQPLAASHLREGALRTWIEDVLQFDERAPAGWVAPPATVAVCTRERPADLAHTLDAISRLDHAPKEIIVVDNAPVTDATRQVVTQHPNVRYVAEPVKGLDRARNRALREARTDIIAFTDDDAAPERGWLGGLLANFNDPRVMCVTGLTLPAELETPAQELFEEHCSFSRGFVRRVFNGRVDSPLLVASVGAGANMAVRRSLADHVGWFDERLDAGTPAQSGGDHEMFTRILSAGYRIVYDPRAVSWHRHRRTFDEVVNVVRGYGTGVYAMWTGLLVEHRNLGVLRLAWRWFRYDHLPLLKLSRLRTWSARDRLRRAELRGCLRGPVAWLSSSRTARRAS